MQITRQNAIKAYQDAPLSSKQSVLRDVLVIVLHSITPPDRESLKAASPPLPTKLRCGVSHLCRRWSGGALLLHTHAPRFTSTEMRACSQRRLRLGEGGTLIKEVGKWVVDLTKCARPQPRFRLHTC